MLELYNTSFSTCSQKVRICLAEKGVSWVDRPVDLTQGGHLTAEYLALNQNGVVPTLVHDGQIIIESSVIVEYLDEVFATPSLSPSGAVARAHMRAWMRYIDEVPTYSVRIPSFNKLFIGGMRKRSDEEYQAYTERMPLRKQFYRKFAAGDGFDQTEYDTAIERLRQTMERVERAVADGPWLLGDMFSLADILLTPLVQRMEDLQLDDLWTDLAGATGWFARVRERPSFAKAFYPGSRLSAGVSIEQVEASVQQTTKGVC